MKQLYRPDSSWNLHYISDQCWNRLLRFGGFCCYGFCCRASLLDVDHMSDTGAANRNQPSLQAVMVVLLRSRRLDPPQHQSLEHNGSGPQVQVFLPLQVQASMQQTLSLWNCRWEQRLISWHTGDREGGRLKNPPRFLPVTHLVVWYSLVRPRWDGDVLQRSDVPAGY